jgi:uracil-DNA glycosylase
LNTQQLLSHEWLKFLKDELSQPYFADLQEKLAKAFQNSTVFPPQELVFSAFNLCPPQNVKVVIIGQDPYHAAGQAHGLCFSVNQGVRQPPSLKNIFKEISADIPGFVAPEAGDLRGWAKQGVLLLNTILTVEEAKPGSHKNLGWERFTDAVITKLSTSMDHLVFMLWGNYAIGKTTLIDDKKHLILTAAHPSPLARGAFFGCKHFSKANNYLTAQGKEPVNWSLS